MIVVKAERILLPGKGFLKGHYLVVKDGIVERISPGEPPACGRGTTMIIAGTVAPMLCDYHLHFSHDKLPVISGIAGILQRCGICRVYEGGDRDLSGVEAGKTMKGLLDVRTSGYALYREGTYGKPIGKGIRTVAEAREAIDLLLAIGVRYIKIINSGVFSPEHGWITAGGFGAGDLKDIVAYASEQGLPVYCHASGDRAVRAAVIAGVSTVIHGFFAADETLSMMAGKNVSFIPTLHALHSLKQVYDDPGARQRIEKAGAVHIETVSKARELGVRVLPGSDSGPAFLPYGSSYHDEFVMLTKAGFSIEAVLENAVSGQIRAGGEANFIILDNLAVEGVFLRGQCLR